jgi:uncharacterized protein (DUF305 family)
MKIPTAIFLLALLIAPWGVSSATEYENDDDDRSGHVPVIAHEIFVLGPGETIDAAIVRADLEYIAGMVPHHEGALTMSQDYLADPRGTNPLLRKLAHAITYNQRFEIGVDGLEHQWQFVKRPPPSSLDLALAPGLEPSERDVKFSREMMIHHQAAVDMARSYNADPKAANRIIKRLNFDIVVDQTNEIAFLERMLDRYPGDPNAIEIDEMIPGMEHMQMDHGAESMEGMDHDMRH